VNYKERLLIATAVTRDWHPYQLC